MSILHTKTNKKKRPTWSNNPEEEEHKQQVTETIPKREKKETGKGGY